MNTTDTTSVIKYSPVAPHDTLRKGMEEERVGGEERGRGEGGRGGEGRGRREGGRGGERGKGGG